MRLTAALLAGLAMSSVGLADVTVTPQGSTSSRIESGERIYLYQRALPESQLGAQFRSPNSLLATIETEIDSPDTSLDTTTVVEMRSELTGDPTPFSCVPSTNTAPTPPTSNNALESAIYCTFNLSTQGDVTTYQYNFYLRENFRFDFETLIDRETVTYTVSFVGRNNNGPTGNEDTAEIILTIEDNDEGVPVITTAGDALTGLTITENPAVDTPVQTGASQDAIIAARPARDPEAGIRYGQGDDVTNIEFVGPATIRRINGTSFTSGPADDPNYPFTTECVNEQCSQVRIKVRNSTYLNGEVYSSIGATLRARDSNSETRLNRNADEATASAAGWSSGVEVTVTIISGIDDPPAFVENLQAAPATACLAPGANGYEVSLNEGDTVNLSLCALDLDREDSTLPVTYTIDGADAELFTVNPRDSTTGTTLFLSGGARPNFEDRSSYDLTVTAATTRTDGSPTRTSLPTRIIININDIDETPQIDDQNLTVPVDLAAGQSAGSPVIASSGDSEADNDNPLVFSFETGLAGVTPGFENVFEIDPATGDIRLQEDAILGDTNPWILGVRITDEDRGDSEVADTDTALVSLIYDTATIALESIWVAENDTSGVAVISVNVTGVLGTPLDLIINTEDDSATAGIDYVPLNNRRVTIPAGIYETQDRPATITVAIIDDDINDEGNETLNITATLPPTRTGVTFATGGEAAVLTIAEDDAPRATFTSDAVALEEGQEDSQDVLVTVQLDRTLADDLNINYRILDTSTATTTVEDMDYVLEGLEDGAGVLVIPGGQLMASVTIQVTGDTEIELDDTVLIGLEAGEGYVVGAVNQYQLTISDDDAPVATFIQPTAPDQLEGNSGALDLLVTVQLDKETPVPLTMNYSVLPETTATLDLDYELAGVVGRQGILRFAAGTSSQTLRIRVIGDEDVEIDDLLILRLENGSGYRVGEAGEYRLVIKDDDAVNIEFVDTQVTEVEGDVGDRRDITVLMRLARPTEAAITLNYEVLAETTATPNVDYILRGISRRRGSLEIGGGTDSASLNITILGDNDAEGDEVIILRLIDDTDYNLVEGLSEHTITIGDDDLAEVAFETAESTFVENDSDTATAVINVVLNRISTVPLTIGYRILVDTSTATMGSDYEAPDLVDGAGTLNVPASETEVEILIAVNGDVTSELNETIVFEIDSGTNYRVGDPGRHTLIITNDDPGSTLPERTMELETMELAVASSTLNLVLDSIRPRLSEYPGGFSSYPSTSYLNLAARLAAGLGSAYGNSATGNPMQAFSGLDWKMSLNRIVDIPAPRGIEVEDLSSGSGAAILWMRGGARGIEGDQQMNRGVFDYEGLSYALSLGADFKVSEALALGLAFSYLDSSLDYQLTGTVTGATDTNGTYDESGFMLNAYGSLQGDGNLRLWGVLGAGLSEIEDTRTANALQSIQGADAVTENADADTTTFLLALGGEYKIVSNQPTLPLELELRGSIHGAFRDTGSFTYSESLMTVPGTDYLLSELRAGIRAGISIPLGISGGHFHPYIGADGVFNIGDYHLDDTNAIDTIIGLTWQKDTWRLTMEANREFLRDNQILWGALFEARIIAKPGEEGFSMAINARRGSPGLSAYGNGSRGHNGDYSAFTTVHANPAPVDRKNANAWALGGEYAYGIRTALWGGGTLIQYLRIEPALTDNRYTIGMRFRARKPWYADIGFTHSLHTPFEQGSEILLNFHMRL